MCTHCNNKACTTAMPTRHSITQTDPVCGTKVDASSSLALNIDGVRHVFCSTLCMTRFLSAQGARS